MPNFNKPILQAARITNGTLKLSSEQAMALNLEDQAKTSIHSGQSHVQIIISISQSLKNKNIFYLSTSDLNKLHLHSGRSYGAWRQADGIHLGPVIGIMAQASNQLDRPFGGQSYFFKQLIIEARRLGEICFAFSPYSVNWAKKTIRGYSYRDNHWVRGVFPLPDVIYPREKGYSPFNRRIRDRLKAQGCKFLNPPLIGKWQTYQIFSKKNLLKEYLPETRLVKDFRQVDRMINRYQAVYMKPVTGSMGRNIIKVTRRNVASPYEYQYQRNNRMYDGSAISLAGLRSSLRPVMRNQTYIVQKRINLLRSQGNILDVRVLVQKDHTGVFSITGKACRVGRPGSITSNISAGGQGRKLEIELARHFSRVEERERIIQEINMLALESARVLDESIGNIGELGIDIGVDRSGQIWFIEANLRPARQVFTLIGEKRIRQDSVVKPLLYCRYLASQE